MHELNMCRAAVHFIPSAAACSRLRVFIFFTATSPLCHLCMSGRGAAPPCISLFDLFPMASNAFHFGLHGFDASASALLRTSYRLLGWVTFVHHTVKVHVRQLLALGYDSPEYFIFYIPLNTFGFGHITWPILHLFTFEFNESSRAPAHGPGPNIQSFTQSLGGGREGGMGGGGANDSTGNEKKLDSY